MKLPQTDKSFSTASDTGKMHYAFGIALLAALLGIPLLLRTCGFVPLS